MKTNIRTIAALGLLTVSTAALAGCSHPHHDDHHGDHSGPGMMMQDGGHMMMHDRMSGSQGHHEGMHGEAHQMGEGHPFMHDHQRMMEDMHGFELTGDADYDFVRGMIPHHQGAIDMAETLLSEGSDPELLALAEDIIQAQKTEIAEMEAWLDAYGEPRPGDHAADIRSGYERANTRMMRDMMVMPTGDINRDFVLGMIPHHEAAIDMAYILLRYSEDTELRTLAEAVIREQEREIRDMRAWLAR
ncbi:MAG: DUF305 domain-containing protein [Natronospirillum sp.]|uniref:CopM family metallochaperone n=1 Tax=Natronospirillum sp. TaxID=2812955 RepID=UPI0025EB472A|nr:DUF305 domain-containing protein [Natronospirillum sp.]MCH8552301.1 DUF305 domain-containing protein [Natronospirillum sp.]